MAKRCTECNHENPDDTLFCGKCGTQFPEIEKIAVTETMETPREELTTGSTFAGRYQIIEELGKGGMGRVYKVLDKEVNAKVALKLIKPEISSDRKTIERFRNELKIARDISHKNVCRMYDLGREEGAYYITMEYVPGEDLKSFIRRSGVLSVGKAVAVAGQVCEGLIEAHRLGVVHRDLKPQNIMIDKEGNARIMDFGIARSLRAKGITGSGVMIGTPEYMSPEQVDGKEADQRADIYSLGVILYEMVTGRVPFEGDTSFSIGVKQKSEIPRPPKEINDQIPEDLNRVILKCLEKEKEKRVQSAGELHSELMNLEKGIPTTERIAPERKPLTSREITVKFTPKRLLIPAAVVAVLIAAGLFLVLRKVGPPLDPNRVVVAPFENKTGDPKLDNIGFMASDWITQGLMQTEMVSVSSLPATDAFKGTQDEKDRIRLIARATRAGKIVTGAYYLEGQTMRFAARVLDARGGKLLGSVEPASGPAEEPVKIIESLRQKVMGVLAVVLDANLHVSSWGHIPTHQAYQVYMEGAKSFLRNEYAKSIEFMYEAMRLDPDFLLPLGYIAAAHSNRGEFAEKQEVTHKLEEVRDKLSPYQKVNLERLQASLKGDRAEQYRAFKRLFDLDPAWNAYGLGWAALRINRPREAVEVFRTADPESPLIKGWVAYWNFYSYAYHMLGEHKKELKIARQARKAYPDRHDALWIEMRALAALGRMGDLERLLEESRQLPPQGTYDLAELLISSGQELRAHGHREESRGFFERAIRWLEARPAPETRTENHRSRMANLLYWTERWDEAKAMYEALAEENPDSLDYRSSLGRIAARVGDREEAQRISDELASFERPYLFGRIQFHQACITSLLGEKEKAVRLLLQSANLGRTFGPGGFHPSMDLEPLADYPPFKEFIKSKG